MFGYFQPFYVNGLSSHKPKTLQKLKGNKQHSWCWVLMHCQQGCHLGSHGN